MNLVPLRDIHPDVAVSDANMLHHARAVIYDHDAPRDLVIRACNYLMLSGDDIDAVNAVQRKQGLADQPVSLLRTGLILLAVFLGALALADLAYGAMHAANAARVEAR